jgi:superfamily II DNA or RNA helicase
MITHCHTEFRINHTFSSGKCFDFSRDIMPTPRDVLVVVHREPLTVQVKDSTKEAYGLRAQPHNPPFGNA